MARLIYKDGIRFMIEGDLNDPRLRSLMAAANADLMHLKATNINSLDLLKAHKPNAYTVESNFGIDTVHISLPKVGFEKKQIIRKVSIEERKEVIEEYVVAHEVWIMPNPGDKGGAISGDYANARQIGYLLCQGGGWNPPYELIEPILKEESGSIIRNVIHPYGTRAMYDALIANGGNAVPFFWNSWKGHYQINGSFPTPPWGNAPMEEVIIEDVLFIDANGTQYIDTPCLLPEVYAREEAYSNSSLVWTRPGEEYGEGSLIIPGTFIGGINYGYSWPVSPAWGCALDNSKYAYYYEWEIDLSQDGGPYKWYQGLRINGEDIILRFENSDWQEFVVRSGNPIFHMEELSEAVCVKYFELGDAPPIVLMTNQRFKLSWQDDGFPDRGPEMWFVSKFGNEAHDWSQTIPEAEFSGDQGDADDDWFGGINGNSTMSHFRRIPEAELYEDENGAQHELLTAGQFRLLKLFTEKEYDPVIKEEQIEI